jgi:2-keto-4-pentenoate hydratase/2-oxohepta-3-ene-1,7-dioic acid hydratase in catechol pathway
MIVRFKLDGQVRGGSLSENRIVSSGDVYSLDEVELLAPCRPSKVVCVGLNYAEHAKELKMKLPQEPILFLKPPSAVIGPEEKIVMPKCSQQVDYEGELGVVMGKRCKDVLAEDVGKYVLGYTCFNDITERPLSVAQGQLTRSKGFDTFAPFGPCIATDLDPSTLTLRTFLNGKLMQEARLTDMIFSVPYLVHYLSQCMTLFPGDIISAGTPRGVAAMKPGDVVEVAIDGIGTLRNPVTAA